MRKILTLSGLKQSGKRKIAEQLERNENCSYIRPFTSAKDCPEDFIKVDEDYLYQLAGENPPLSFVRIGDYNYVYFEMQLDNDFNIIIADDDEVVNIQKNYDGEVYTIWIESKNAEPSERSGKHGTSYYDYVFNANTDSLDEFIEEVAFDVEFVQGGT